MSTNNGIGLEFFKQAGELANIQALKSHAVVQLIPITISIVVGQTKQIRSISHQINISLLIDFAKSSIGKAQRIFVPDQYITMLDFECRLNRLSSTNMTCTNR